jgi:hypothetical protein
MEYSISRSQNDGLSNNDVALSNFYSVQFVNPAKFAIKPFRIIHDFEISKRIMRYSLSINNLNSYGLYIELWQKASSTDYAFLARLFTGFNHVDLPLFSDPTIEIAAVCLPSVKSIELGFEMGSSPGITGQTFQTLEWTLENDTTSSFPIPNFANLDKVNSRLSVNGTQQNDIVDYTFSNGQLNWISPDFQLSTGDFLSLSAIYL